MKNSYASLTLSLLLILTSVPSGAYAASGGDIRYEYVNDSTYLFYYRMYRECSRFPEPNSVSLCYRNTCAGIWYTERIQKLPFAPDGRPNGQPVDPGCANLPTTCSSPSGTLKMYREWWYGGKVVLNQRCNRWIFSVNWDRDDPATNLLPRPAFDYNVYVEATIDNLNAPRQSAPYFTASIPVFACDGVPFHYNHGMTDPDGDSLAYSVVQPLSATWDITVICSGYPPLPMGFYPQYNLTNNPLGTNNTFSMDPATGEIRFTPAGAQESYITFLVEKYRNGRRIGSVMRDFRMEVRNCTSPEPQFSLNRSSVSGATMTGDTLSLCGNTEVSFCFDVQTPVAGTAFRLKDNSHIALKGAAVSYQNQGSARVTGCVVWTPGMNDTGFRYFVVQVKDSTCNGSGFTPVVQTFTIPVFVRTGTVAEAQDTLICPGTSTQLAASGGRQFNWTSDPASGFSCTQCPLTTVSPKETTRYIVRSDLNNGCSNTDTVTVAVDWSNYIVATPDTIVLCGGADYVTLSSEAHGPRPLKTIACGAYSPRCSGAQDTVTLAQGSNNSSNNNVYYNYVEYYGPFYQYYRTQKMQVIYRKEDLRGQGMRPGTIQRLALNYAPYSGVSPTFSNVKIMMRCTEKSEFVTLAQTEFEVGLVEVFSAASVTLQQGWNEFEFNVPYDYDTSKNLVVQFCYSGSSPNAINPGGGMLPIYYITTPYNSSIAAGQQAIGNACASPLGTVRTYNRRPDTRFTFCELPEDNFRYTWTPADGMDDPGAASTGVFVDSTTWFKVTTRGRNGCVVSDSVLVYIPDYNFSIEPPEADICEGESIQLAGRGGYYYNWYDDAFGAPPGFSCTDCAEPVITPPLGMNRYQVIVKDYFGCGDTLPASIFVRPAPAVRILNNDTLINYGDQITLTAEGTSNYLWNPASSLDNPDIAMPVASPLNTTLYIVAGWEPNGCPPKYDSVLVRVNLRERIHIPSAFSPNGDGKNDVFRIAHLKFSKILVFQVYNRLGEEVYNAPLAGNGWDGTWKGMPQPVGTYYYYIQVVFPDNVMETYKGDVTLVR